MGREVVLGGKEEEVEVGEEEDLGLCGRTHRNRDEDECCHRRTRCRRDAECSRWMAAQQRA